MLAKIFISLVTLWLKRYTKTSHHNCGFDYLFFTFDNFYSFLLGV
jgi:hypothetical protein